MIINVFIPAAGETQDKQHKSIIHKTPRLDFYWLAQSWNTKMSRALWQPVFILDRLLLAMAESPRWPLEQLEKQGNGPLRAMRRSGGRLRPACKPGDEQSTCSRGDTNCVFFSSSQIKPKTFTVRVRVRLSYNPHKTGRLVWLMSGFWISFSPHQPSALPKLLHTANRRRKIQQGWRHDSSATRTMVHTAALWHPPPSLWLGEWRRANCEAATDAWLRGWSRRESSRWRIKPLSHWPKKQPKPFTSDNWELCEL